MAMKLLKFRVTNFRSVKESGWIDADAVTALIGTNESGKTNLLAPLWKLNPAKDGSISQTADYPRKDFNTFRQLDPQPVFVEAVFDVGEELAAELAALSDLDAATMRQVSVSRRFDGEYIIAFPAAPTRREVAIDQVLAALNTGAEAITADSAMKSEQALKPVMLQALADAKAGLPSEGLVTAAEVAAAADILEAVDVAQAPARSTLAPRFARVREEIGALREQLARPLPSEVGGITELVLKRLPKFVYYSNYGNLDSEIYLPQVIQNLSRTDLGAKEEAKARTLRVLFDFVKLSPSEIHELGREAKDARNPGRVPTEEELAAVAEKKKQRSILLQSASTQLTTSFREWWRQGDYRFRFQADGDHFRIWVSDDKRPEEIELEGRSTGLQWFLSFYLVFLVESADAHAGAILLLDEPGLSLHPRAQRDLSLFFDGLASTNQLLYTTHSPFMVDADHLDRARKVFVAADGTTKASADLRADDGDPNQRAAGYAVHAALNLSVAESLLLGCTPVVVEGPSDQHYLTAIKVLLVAAGHLAPGRELVFPPCGGAKGAKAVASILGCRSDQPPVALFDSDRPGRDMADALKKSLYVGEAASRIVEVGDFTAVRDGEIEDLFAPEIIARELDRMYRDPDVTFAETYRPGSAIIPQITGWASEHGVTLALGWKVELAKRVKASLLKDGPGAVPEPILKNWKRLFDVLQGGKRDSSRGDLAIA